MKAVLLTIVLALSFAGRASATDPYAIANLGYSVTVITYENCTAYKASGFGVSVTLQSSCDPGGVPMGEFVRGHPERKLGYEHPGAITARSDIQSKGYAVTTDYAIPTFRVAGDCNVDKTVDVSGLIALAASLPVSAPCPPPTPPVTPTTPTTTTTPAATPSEPAAPSTDTTTTTTATTTATVEERLADLEKKYEELAARVDAIQKANEAAWRAWVAATAGGLPAHEAALAARSAGLNMLYGIA